ncbi:SLBB domain-containing protein [Tellurirhabdus rosea]|uniref:SLBB domain-containing protein n=1 Tax=Tellurirhabdus rosea TaxID=2674997 RepID=UPI0022598C7E|nr:SLBB domain-containing protein [Tellurirhabdus rosea]
MFRVLAAFLLILWIAAPPALAQQPSRGSRVDQLTDEQVLEFYRRAQSSGLNEMQIEQAALSQGFTLSDIAKMRQRIAKLRLQQNKSGGSGSTGGSGQDFLGADSTGGRSQQGRLSQRNMYSDSLDPFRRDSLKKPVVFGASLFRNASLSFEPNLRIATPRNYQLGPDDELTVEIYGNSTDNYRLRVSPEGTVRLLNLGPIFVSGLTIEQAEQRIVGRLRSAYQGLNRPGSGTYATVTLGNIRSIRVTIVGEVMRPGTFTISSLATTFNALYLAGGPNPETGTFRDIRVMRNNRLIRTIDLYNFLLRADQSDNIRLQDNDVILVGNYNARVELAGEVKRPALYEVKTGETLKTLLAFAGNFTDKAYTASITLRRNTARELRVVTVAPEQFATFVPQAGDKYTIGEILERYENRIQITGAVMRPGEYALGDDLATVGSLIRRAEGLRKDAFLNRGHVYRERENMDLETIPFDVGRLMRNETPDIPLLRQDSIHIFSQRDLRETYYVQIQGAVNQPDTFQFVNNMSVADLIALAGGFQEGATPTQIEVARRIREDSLTNDQRGTVNIFRFAIDRNLRLSPDQAGFSLQPFDIVYVRTSPQYEEQQNAYIYGEVMHPGSYAIQSNQERLSDLIKRSGGLKPNAFLSGARLYRNGQLIATDIIAVINNRDIAGNLLLQNGDSLLIPGRQDVVRIEGAVLNNPSIVSFRPEFRLKDYITQAGGVTENARFRKAYIVYANGLKDLYRKNPKMQPGATIVVPYKPLEESRLTPTERLGIFSLIGTLIATSATVLVNLINRP